MYANRILTIILPFILSNFYFLQSMPCSVDNHVCPQPSIRVTVRTKQHFWLEWESIVNNSSLQCPAWIYCPNHAAVPGNERADRLASIATGAATITPKKEGFVKTIYKRMLVNDTGKDYIAVSRLRESGTKCDCNRKERQWGRIRCIYNWNNQRQHIVTFAEVIGAFMS